MWINLLLKTLQLVHHLSLIDLVKTTASWPGNEGWVGFQFYWSGVRSSTGLTLDHLTEPWTFVGCNVRWRELAAHG